MKAVCIVLVGACVLVGGCGGSGGTEQAGSAREKPGDPGCKKPGIRYAGRTASGVNVCFTLSPDVKTWREIGYLYVGKKGCPGAGQGIYWPSEQEGSGPGRFIADFFTARIHGVRAAGFIEDENFCRGRRFAWNARTTQPLSAQALRNLNPAPRSECRKPGVRYVGKAAGGAVVVCFTLNSYRTSVIETGWGFGRVSGCGGDVDGESTGSGDKFDLEASGHFDDGLGLTGTIHGDRATGLLTDPDLCPSRTFKWVARHAP